MILVFLGSLWEAACARGSAGCRPLELPIGYAHYMTVDLKAAVAEADAVLGRWQEQRRQGGHDDGSGTSKDQQEAVATLLVSAVHRLTTPGSPYRRRSEDNLRESGQLPHLVSVAHAGILQAVRDDYSSGRVQAVAELVRADLFADYLSMAEYLLNDGYKDPAAVIIGSSLEAHLRAVCQTVGVPNTHLDGTPLKASRLNDDLDKAGVYSSKLEKTSVLGWLQLRNDAAHGSYAKYTDEQVRLLLDGVRDFMQRHPA